VPSCEVTCDKASCQTVQDSSSGRPFEVETLEHIATHDSTCPPALALSAVELSLDKETLERYREHYNKKKLIRNDNIFITWKTYKDVIHDQNSVPHAISQTPEKFPINNSSYPGIQYALYRHLKSST